MTVYLGDGRGRFDQAAGSPFAAGNNPATSRWETSMRTSGSTSRLPTMRPVTSPCCWGMARVDSRRHLRLPSRVAHIRTAWLSGTSMETAISTLRWRAGKRMPCWSFTGSARQRLPGSQNVWQLGGSLIGNCGPAISTTTADTTWSQPTQTVAASPYRARTAVALCNLQRRSLLQGHRLPLRSAMSTGIAIRTWPSLTDGEASIQTSTA